MAPDPCSGAEVNVRIAITVSSVNQLSVFLDMLSLKSLVNLDAGRIKACLLNSFKIYDGLRFFLINLIKDIFYEIWLEV